MKFFPWVIISKKRLAEIHHRSRTLDSIQSGMEERLEGHMKYEMQLEQQIGALADKCSRVGVSKLENEIVKLRKELGGHEAPPTGGFDPETSEPLDSNYDEDIDAP